MTAPSYDLISLILKLGDVSPEPKDYPPRIYDVLEIIEKYRNKTRPLPPFCLIITNDDLNKMDIDLLNNKLAEILSPVIQTNNHIILNHNINIVQNTREVFTTNAEAKQRYLLISQKECCVFFISDEGTHIFVKGEEIGNNNFFTGNTLGMFIKKKDVSDLEEVLNEYKAELKKTKRYYKFFVPLGLLKRVYGQEYTKNKNLLLNKPERHFRDDLKDFLQEKIDRTFNFNREVLLDSNQRLDINTEDKDGNHYFLEIKWIGKSIHANCEKEGTCYNEVDIKKFAIKQTLEYIKELQSSNKYVKLGWLTIFDARQKKEPLDFSNYDHIDDDLKRNLHLFRIISDLAIDNINPQ